MDLAALIPIVLKISLGVVVFALGLSASNGDLTHLLRRPSLLVRSILSMYVVMPIIAVAVAKAFALRPLVELALIVLSVSPVPPILPGKQAKAGGSASYAIGLLFVAAALSIVVVPAAVAIIAKLFGHDIAVPASKIAMTVATSVLAPLLLGAIVRRIAPGIVGAAPMLSKIAMVLLLLAFVPVLVKFWPAIAAQVGDFTIVAIVLFTVVALAVGHLLGGPDPEDRTVLALATASRHPGVAIAIASAATAVAAPEQAGAAAATVLLAVLVSAVVTGPYVKWRKKGHAAAVAAQPS